MIIVQTAGAEETAKKLKALPAKIKEAIGLAVKEMGMKTTEGIIGAADFENFTGDIRNNTKYVERPTGDGGEVIMPQHGIWVDRASPHLVSMNQSKPQLVAWGLQAKSERIREAAAAISRGDRKSMLLHVQPHPFIEKGFKRSSINYETILRTHLDRAFV